MQKIIYIISDINKALAFEWIAQKLDRTRFILSVILIGHWNTHLENFLQKEGLQCTVLYYKSQKGLPKVLIKLYKLLKNNRPDAVHCHLLHGSLLGLTAAKLAGVKKRIYTRHHSDFHHRYFPKGIKWDRWCNRLASHIVAPSGAVKEVLLKLEKVPEEKITVIHHGFDLSYFEKPDPIIVKSLQEKYSIDGHQPVIGVISRLTKLKGIQYIIPAIEKLYLTHPNLLLMIFGAVGDYETVIKYELQKALPPNNYKLVEFESNLSAVYPLFDVFIQASTDRTIEAFGQTYVEALAAGVPSVFTLAGIANDFVKDHKNALVVPYENAEAIYDALTEIINNKTLQKKLSSEGKKSVKEKFDLQVMINQLEDLYES